MPVRGSVGMVLGSGKGGKGGSGSASSSGGGGSSSSVAQTVVALQAPNHSSRIDVYMSC